MVVGAVLAVAGKVPFLGRLHGDILFRENGLTIVAPVATMIVLSLVFTILLNLVKRLFR